jgi:hypothetical protein
LLMQPQFDKKYQNILNGYRHPYPGLFDIQIPHLTLKDDHESCWSDSPYVFQMNRDFTFGKRREHNTHSHSHHFFGMATVRF